MKGITIPCSHCKQILIRYINVTGEGSFETLCPHCDGLNKVTITQKTVVTVTLLKVVLVLFLFSGLIYFFMNFGDPNNTFVVNLLGG